jgi:cytochrome subunit of sulfide dehydrogenase
MCLSTKKLALCVTIWFAFSFCSFYKLFVKNQKSSTIFLGAHVIKLKLNLSLAAMLLASQALALEPLPGKGSALIPSTQTSTNPAYLAANCANCHGTKGNAAGAMPSLAGLKAGYISEQMRAFRDGKRPATIMHQLAKGYTDAQIDAIAGYFAAQTAK